MPELRSALATQLRAGRYGAGTGDPGVVLTERPLGTLVQIAGWRDSFESAAGAVLQRLGFRGVGDFDCAQVAGDALAFRCAPERVLLRFASPAAWAAIFAGIDQALTPVLDLSHSRTVLSLTGAKVADLLARVLPIDCDDAEFPVDRFVQSALHSVGVLVHRRAGGFEISVPRSFAVAIWEVLTENAEPFGYRVDGPT